MEFFNTNPLYHVIHVQRDFYDESYTKKQILTDDTVDVKELQEDFIVLNENFEQFR